MPLRCFLFLWCYDASLWCCFLIVKSVCHSFLPSFHPSFLLSFLFFLQVVCFYCLCSGTFSGNDPLIILLLFSINASGNLIRSLCLPYLCIFCYFFASSGITSWEVFLELLFGSLFLHLLSNLLIRHDTFELLISIVNIVLSGVFVSDVIILLLSNSLLNFPALSYISLNIFCMYIS